MRPALRALGLCLALLAPMAAEAQDLATLIADKVAVSGDTSLVASGGVEVLYQGRRLRASRIIYDKTTDKLQIEGPITLSDGTDTLLPHFADHHDPDRHHHVHRPCAVQ